MEELMKAQKTLLIVLALCSLFPCMAQGPGGRMEPPLVLVDIVKETDSVTPKRYVGMVEAIENVDVVPRITGTLLKTHFREGELVKKGTLLYSIEDTAYKAAVEKLEANKDLLEAAHHFARIQFRRSSTLRKSAAVAEAAHDKAVMDYAAARANLKEVAAGLKDARNTLSYTKIYAPITGRIGKSLVSDGNLLTPGSGKLANIVMTAPIFVRFSVSEKVLRREFGSRSGVRKNASVKVRLADGSLYQENAPVTLIDNKINASTNTITLWAVFKNADGLLEHGSFVTVLLSRKGEKKLPAVLPSALIAEPDGGYAVYVLDKNNKVVKRRIKIGGLSGSYQKIRAGVKSGERVIVEGMHKVRPGDTVRTAPLSAAK